MNNGDGLYFINENGEADGLQINVVLNDLVIPNTYKSIPVGTDIYRNSDAAFNRLVEREDATIRKIGVQLSLNETAEGFELIVIDEDGHTSSAIVAVEKEVSNKGEQVLEDIKKNLSKTGNTPFLVDKIELNLTDNWFLASSKVNEMRREALDNLITVRIDEYVRLERQIVKTDHPFPVQQLDFTYNVSNRLARQFYKRHGVIEIEKAFELQWDPGKSRVMTTKYCVKYELGKCPKFQRESMGEKAVEPLTLKHGENEYKLKFNCKPCEMEIWEKDAELTFEEDL